MSIECRYNADFIVPLSYDNNEVFDKPLPPKYLQIILVESGCSTLRINQERCFISSGALIFRSSETAIELCCCHGMKARSISFKSEFFDINKRYSSDKKIQKYLNMCVPFHLFFENNDTYIGILQLDSLVRPKACALVLAIISEMQNQPDNMWCNRVLINLIELFRLAEDEYIRYIGKGASITSLANMALNYIHSNYNKEITVEMLCRLFHTNHTTLLRNFRTLTGTTIGQYILEYRLQLVCEALAYTNLTLDEISSKYGFGQASYLSRVFRSRMGITPGQYRRNRNESKKRHTASTEVI